MNRIKYYFILFSIVLINNVNAQNFNLKELPIHISYYGDNGIHPGVKLGTSYQFWSKEKSKIYRLGFRQNKHGNKIKHKELNLDYNLGLYSHANNHVGVFTGIGMSYLRIKERKGRLFGLAFELGYLRRFYKFSTYELNEDGTIYEYGAAGNNAIMVSIAPVFGKQFKISDHTVRFFAKPNIQLVKYNEKMQPNASAEIGMTFNINNK